MIRRTFRYNRKYDTRKEAVSVAIFANGEQTEENYFQSLCRDLNLASVRVKPGCVYIEGTEYNTVSLVEYADRNRGDYDEVWVVFDRDDQTKLFDDAIKLAKERDIKVAYSNECFELWFVLHFDYLDTATGREKYFEKLTSLLGIKYEKNIDVYSLIKNKENIAMKGAEKLEKEKAEVNPFHKRDPSTTVHLLVKRLREIAKEREE